MIDAHLRKLRSRDIISRPEEAAIRGAVSQLQRYAANSVIAPVGEALNHSHIVVDGWLAAAKEPHGYDRQIVALSIAGDFADLHALALRRLDHEIVALTDCEVALVPHWAMQRLIDRSPHLSRLYRVMGDIDAAVGREWAASLGRRSRAAHMAHLFCELLLRLEIVGLSAGNSYEFPLTQYQLADCLGATPVHVNRVLQELRAAGLVKLERRRLTITDEDGLRALARFEPDYLFAGRNIPHASAVVDCEAASSQHGIRRRGRAFAADACPQA